MRSQSNQEQASGVFYAIGAYLCWGLFPLYWKPLESIEPLQIICHRVLWSALFLLLVLSVRRHWSWLAAFRAAPGKLGIFCLSSTMLTANWLMYIWAVNAGHIVESSLGYFINPLVNVLLGRLFLGEQLGKMQKVAVLLAACGVMWMTLQLGAFPWISLGLALSFGVYGLLRKQAPLPSLEGLTLETLLMAPLALIVLAVFEFRGTGCFGHIGWKLDTMLMGAGVITTVPLLLFAHGARRLKLATIGLIQYISPTLQLLLGVLLYHEAFDSARAVGFALIWAGLLVYTAGSVRSLLRARLA
jgi:chloramphenicol-sensitive protein RarD